MSKWMKPSEVFAARLRDMREARGLSQAELAQLATEQGCELDRAAVLRIENGKRRLALDEAVALAWALRAVPAQLLTAPEGATLALTDDDGVDGEGLRNWFVYGDPLLAQPASLETDEARAIAEARLENTIIVYARALTDAVLAKDTAGVKELRDAIVRAVYAHQRALGQSDG
jgi:transcriptional regulator with XRE-family HTH domain